MSSTLAPCQIGISLEEDCHKITLVQKQGLYLITSFNKEDKEILELRCCISFSDEDKVCFHHEKYLSYYQTRQIQCADPFGRHKKRVISKFYLFLQ